MYALQHMQTVTSNTEMRDCGLPVKFECLKPLSNLENQVEALVWLARGEWQDLTLDSMVSHVLQHRRMW